MSLKPEIFVPRSVLELPYGQPNEVNLEIIAEADMIITPISAAPMLGRHMSCYPEWCEWDDGRGASIRILNQAGCVPLALFSGNPDEPSLLTPYNTDGYTVYDGEKRIIACGVAISNQLSVLWGISTQPLSELITVPDEVDLQLMNTRDPKSQAQVALKSGTI